MIIYGWGEVTRSRKGGIAEKQCRYCNEIHKWQLCVRRTWFTLFFIPVIPYKTEYCIECPNCGSYMEIEKEKYRELLSRMNAQKSLQG